jgi:hypothetical protein
MVPSGLGASASEIPEQLGHRRGHSGPHVDAHEAIEDGLDLSFSVISIAALLACGSSAASQLENQTSSP